MEAKKTHTLTLDSRARGTVTGVEVVISAQDTALVLNTSEGALTLVGRQLHINKFSADDGVLTFEGSVDTLRYSAAKGGSVFKRLFK